MMRLASQPQTPPTMSQIMKFMSVSLLLFRPAIGTRGRSGITTLDASWLFRIGKDMSSSWVNTQLAARQRLVARLALVLVAVLLDPRYAQARHAAAVHRALPAGEFLQAERVTLAGFIDAEQAARNSGDDFGLAPDDP